MSAERAELIFDHVGIVVTDLDAGVKALNGLLGQLLWTVHVDDPGLQVSVCFARDAAGLVYELIAPLGDASPIAGTLRSRRNLLNHIAYRTSDLEGSVAQLRTQRAMPVGPAAPAVAFGGASVQFFMTPLGFIIELIEAGTASHEFG